VVKVLDGRTLTTIATFSTSFSTSIPSGAGAGGDYYGDNASESASASVQAGRLKRPASAGRLRPSTSSKPVRPVSAGLSKGINALALAGPSRSFTSASKAASDAASSDEMIVGMVVGRGTTGRQAAQSTFAIVATTAGRAVRIEIGHPLAQGNRPGSASASARGTTSNTTSATPVFHYHVGSVWGLAIERSAGGTLIVTTGDDRRMCIWDSASHRLLASTLLPSVAHCCYFDRDSQFIAVGYTTGGVAVFSICNSNNQRSQGNGMVTGTGRRQGWGPEGGGTGNASNRLGGGSALTLTEAAFRKDCKEEISDIKFSPSNDRLAAGSHDNSIVVYVCTLSSTTSEVVENRGGGRGRGEGGGGGSCSLQPLHRLRGHTSYITHLGMSYNIKLSWSICWYCARRLLSPAADDVHLTY
jgi:WD40 repeat protein